MIRVYVADALFEARSALRVLLLDLKMEVVGEAADWLTTIANAPAARPDMLVVDWALLPANLGPQSLAQFRTLCANPIVIVLLNNVDAGSQAALSAGADVFISKSEIPERVVARLRQAIANILPPPSPK